MNEMSKGAWYSFNFKTRLEIDISYFTDCHIFVRMCRWEIKTASPAEHVKFSLHLR